MARGATGHARAQLNNKKVQKAFGKNGQKGMTKRIKTLRRDECLHKRMHSKAICHPRSHAATTRHSTTSVQGPGISTENNGNMLCFITAIYSTRISQKKTREKNTAFCFFVNFGVFAKCHTVPHSATANVQGIHSKKIKPKCLRCFLFFLDSVTYCHSQFSRISAKNSFKSNIKCVCVLQFLDVFGIVPYRAHSAT